MEMSKRKIASVFMLLMIPGYILAVFSLPANISTQCEPNVDPETGVTDQVGVCTEVSATIMREYYFGTLRLPVQTLSLNFDLLNKSFIPVLLVSSAVLWREYI
ncbi:MAG: hypothetical protein ACI9LV_000001 [Candidatus Nanohaloarchaea archaeon]|jgi:hypothetical protein